MIEEEEERGCDTPVDASAVVECTFTLVVECAMPWLIHLALLTCDGAVQVAVRENKQPRGCLSRVPLSLDARCNWGNRPTVWTGAGHGSIQWLSADTLHKP